MAAESVGQIGLDLVVNQNQFNKQMGGITSLAKKVGATLVAAFAVKKIVDFGKECVKLGSDLAEVQNVVDVTFPHMTKQVDDFAKNAAAQFGLSETMAKKFTGTFGAMAKSFGFSESAAYDMGSTLTGLAGDVASFYNLSPDEAYTKLKSVFTGETETLKDLGVVMTQTALDSYALANGYGKVTSKMSEAEKVALRYAFVQDQLSAASGDFSRTSGSWANQVRILTLQFDSLKATIGQGLINVFTPVIRAINVLLGKLATVANAFKAFTELLTGNKSSAGSGIADTASGLEDAAGAASDLTDNTTAAGKAAKKAAKDMKQISGIDKLNNLTTSNKSAGSSSSGGSSIGSAVDFGAISDEESSGAVGKLIAKFDKLNKSLQNLSNNGLSKLSNFAFGALKDFYDEFLVPLGNWALGEGLPDLVDVLNDFLVKIKWDSIRSSLARFWKALEPLAEGVGNGLIKFFGKLLDIGADFINVVVPSALNGIASALERFDKQDAEDFATELGKIASALLLFKASSKFAGKIAKIASALSVFKGINLASLFYVRWGGAGTPAFDVIAGEIIELISQAFKKLIPKWSYDLLSTLGGGIVLALAGGAAAGPFGFVAGAIAGALGGLDLSGAIDVKKMFDKVFNFDLAKRLFSDMKDRFQDALNSNNIGDIGINIVEGIVSGLVGALVFLVEPIVDLCDALVSGVKKLLGIHSPSTVFADIGKNIVLGLSKGIQDNWKSFISYVTSLPGKMVDGFGDIKSKFISKGKDILGGIERGWNNNIESFTSWLAAKPESIATALGNISGSFKSKGKDVLDGIQKGWQDNWASFKDWLSSIPSMISKAIGSLYDVGKNIMKTLISGLKSIGLPKMDISLGTKETSVLGQKIKTPSIDIKWLAQGGYVKANTPQLAMIGDNRHQGEVVAPENKLQELLDKAVGASSGTDLSIIVDLIRQNNILLSSLLKKEYLAKITSGEVANALMYENEKAKNKTGRPLLGY